MSHVIILFTDFSLDKKQLQGYGVTSETVLLLCFSIVLGVFSWPVKTITPMIRTLFFLDLVFHC